jgi:hypothetical protein
METTTFAGFRQAFAADPDLGFAIDADETADSLSMTLGIYIPGQLVEFWREVGGGYFGIRTLYVFGGEAHSRGTVMDWNTREYWARLFPSPRVGGPVFIAETCFGLQIGFRWEAGVPVGCMLDVDTLTMYRVEGRFDDMLEREFAERQSFLDPDLHADVAARLGPLKVGMHYAPLVSPLVGGLHAAGNYHVEAPDLHLRGAIATWEALGDLRRASAAG